MNRFTVLAVLVVAILATTNLAVADTVSASADTYVTDHPVLGWEDSVHGSDTKWPLSGFTVIKPCH